MPHLCAGSVFVLEFRKDQWESKRKKDLVTLKHPLQPPWVSQGCGSAEDNTGPGSFPGLTWFSGCPLSSTPKEAAVPSSASPPNPGCSPLRRHICCLVLQFQGCPFCSSLPSRVLSSSICILSPDTGPGLQRNMTNGYQIMSEPKC